MTILQAAMTLRRSRQAERALSADTPDREYGRAFAAIIRAESRLKGLILAGTTLAPGEARSRCLGSTAYTVIRDAEGFESLIESQIVN